jgi:hypothetical protein
LYRTLCSNNWKIIGGEIQERGIMNENEKSERSNLIINNNYIKEHFKIVNDKIKVIMSWFLSEINRGINVNKSLAVSENKINESSNSIAILPPIIQNFPIIHDLKIVIPNSYILLKKNLKKFPPVVIGLFLV